uniref:Hamartin n=1 Tax=Rhabditophanes sp. KR3021 TaxID=114890 RepID=A0AC35U7Q0_9BILA
MPYAEMLLDEILKCLENNPYSTIMLLGQLAQKGSPWISKVPMHRMLLREIINKHICQTSDSILKSAGLIFLTCLLPHCAKVPEHMLILICSTFGVCATALHDIITTKNPNGVEGMQNEAINIHYSLKEFFNVLYGLFPQTLISYLQKSWRDKEIKESVFTEVIEKYFLSVKFNPRMLRSVMRDENMGNHVQSKEAHDIWSEINVLVLDDETSDIFLNKKDVDLNDDIDVNNAMDAFIRDDVSVDFGEEMFPNEDESFNPLNDLGFNLNLYAMDALQFEAMTSSRLSINRDVKLPWTRRVSSIGSKIFGRNRGDRNDESGCTSSRTINAIEEFTGQECLVLSPRDDDDNFSMMSDDEDFGSEYNDFNLSARNRKIRSRKTTQCTSIAYFKPSRSTSCPELNHLSNFQRKKPSASVNVPPSNRSLVYSKMAKRHNLYMKASKEHHICLRDLNMADRFPGIMYDDMRRLLKGLDDKKQVNILRTRLVLVNQHLMLERYSRLVSLQRIQTLFNRLLQEKSKTKADNCLKQDNKNLICKLELAIKSTSDMYEALQTEKKDRAKEIALWKQKYTTVCEKSNECYLNLEQFKKKYDLAKRTEKSDQHLIDELHKRIQNLEAEKDLILTEYQNVKNVETRLQESQKLNAIITDKMNNLLIREEKQRAENQKPYGKHAYNEMKGEIEVKDHELMRMQRELDQSRKEHKVMSEKIKQYDESICLEARKNKEIKGLMTKQAYANNQLVETLKEKNRAVSLLNEKQNEYITVLLGVIEENRNRITANSNPSDAWEIPTTRVNADVQTFSADDLRDSNLLPELMKKTPGARKFLTRRSESSRSTNSETNRNYNRRRFDSQTDPSS